MLTQEEVIKIFKECEALLTGHFLLTSGLHSPNYLEKFQVLQYPKYTTIFCEEFARRFSNDNVELVIGPATGGIILAHETARILKVRSIFTERENNTMKLRRGFSIKKGERLIIVEDILTTGSSLRELIEIIKQSEADILGIGVIADRSGGKTDFGIRLESLATLNIETYKPESCPLCKKEIPLTKPGSKKI